MQLSSVCKYVCSTESPSGCWLHAIKLGQGKQRPSSSQRVDTADKSLEKAAHAIYREPLSMYIGKEHTQRLNDEQIDDDQMSDWKALLSRHMTQLQSQVLFEVRANYARQQQSTSCRHATC